MKLWIASQREGDGEWELGGVFTTEEGARAVCTVPTDCYWSINADEFLGRATSEPDNAVWPVGG